VKHLFAVICATTLVISTAVLAEPNATVTASELTTLSKETIVLDVRTAGEFDAGHIPDAVNIDVNSKDFGAKILQLDASKTYVVHCGANVPNGRADKAISQLEQAGISQLISLEGGYGAWIDQTTP